MSAPFRPSFYHVSESILQDYRNGYSKKAYEIITFPTYRELKRDIGIYIRDSVEEKVTVTRHRRGEWGEWFEVWELDSKGKPKITKSGWM